MSWDLLKTSKLPKLKNPVLIEGLPGIGNVGKVAVDFMIEEIEAKKIAEFHSNAMPHSVFVNDENLVEMPVISLYHKRSKDHDIFFIAGDAQPIDERATYEFCDAVLDFHESVKASVIITLGGIGLPSAPKKPKVFITGTGKSVIAKYAKKHPIESKLYGVVGPIIGATGLLLGLAKRRDLNGIALLAETYGHPMYLGIRGARETVKILNDEFKLGIDMKQLDREIRQLENEAEKAEQTPEVKKAMRGLTKGEASYIG